MNNIAKETIIVSYSGEALNEGSMNLDELLLALTGFGMVINEANGLLNKGGTKITVNIKAFEVGSFHICTELQQSAINFLNAFNDPSITGLIILITLLGLQEKFGLIQLIKALKGKNIDKLEEKGNTYILHVENNTYEIPSELYDLYTDSKVRKGLEKLTKPLEQDGIDEIQFQDINKKTITTINKKELPYFQIKPKEEMLLEKTSEEYLSMVSISFKDGNKWRFTDGEQEFYALINDEEFLYNINNNFISFTKGDTLKVELKKRQWNTEEGLKTDYAIEKVLEHKTAKQLKLNLYRNE
jgi:hypothetical protein